ncbi:MAG TPA: toluene monooxygenase [Polyangia bacterium]|nr:toluene monooxygenase [Polyangia bacterium]
MGARRGVTGEALRTYSHLADARRVPTEYEIGTSRLLYYGERGFEVDVPIAGWYARHQAGSRWHPIDWERFADPRETTYAAYTRAQAAKEAFVDGVLRTIDESPYDRELSPTARALLDRTIAPLRHVFHARQMIAAYVGSMAPSGRIAVAALFQAADELRRVHRFAYRLAQLRRVDAAFGAGARAAFEGAPAWQPLRRVLERLLVTWDWAEAFVALDLVLAPALDHLVFVGLPAIARARGDFLLGQIAASLDEDAQGHKQWVRALARLAHAESDVNRAATVDWIAAWAPEVDAAIEALAPLLTDDDEATAAVAAARAAAAAFRDEALA